MKDLAQRGLMHLFISHNLAVVRHVSLPASAMYLGRWKPADKQSLFSTRATPCHAHAAR
jgi:ABC-type oligopeptide transport system ATPase subunit